MIENYLLITFHLNGNIATQIYLLQTLSLLNTLTLKMFYTFIMSNELITFAAN